MAIKIISLFALFALAKAGVLAPTAYLAQPIVTRELVPAEQPANYQFQYGINDASTGDFKSHSERADNGAVRGSYQLNDADGYLRTVDYTADDIHGFQATVRREPLFVKHVIAQPAITKYIQASPAGWF